MATVTRERELLRELVALVRGECPSLLNEDSGGIVRLSMAIDDALAAPPAEDAGWTRWLGPDETPLQRMEREFRDCQAVTGLLAEARAEIERLKAQAPPAEDATHEYCPQCLKSAKLGTMHALRTDRGERHCLSCHARLQPLYPAQAPPASDPPGLVALVAELRAARDAYVSALSIGMEASANAHLGRIWEAARRIDAYPLPASPQAETKRDCTCLGSCRGAEGLSPRYRCVLASPQAETKGDE